MSEIFAEQFTAVANAVLAVFAIVTAVLAGLAFRKQAREVSDQAEMLNLQRRQLEDQREATAEQGEVLKLQAEDLRESLKERKRQAEAERRAQAAMVAAWFAVVPDSRGPSVSQWGAMLRNASHLPVYDVSVSFYFVEEPIRGLGWTPVARGSSTESIRLLPPQTERHVAMPDDLARQIPGFNATTYVVGITFTDAAGNRWERNPRGALNPIS
jgi:outer membrane murein-binding lipoprotein Lpp